MSEVPKIVHDRLRASLPEGGASAHPDPDLLTAFAEQALSTEERESVLQHLARCGDCREVIALALPAEEAEPVPAIVDEEPAAVRRKSESRWFAWPRLRWVALAAGVVVAGAILLMHPGKPSAPSEARQQPQSSVAEPIGTVAEKPATPAPANSEIASSKEMYRAQPSREADRDKALSAANAKKAPAPVTPDDEGLSTRAVAGQRADAARGARSFGLPQIAQNKLAEKRLAAGLHGTIADMTGAAVPGAQVTFRNMETGDSRTTITDASGLYAFQNVPVGNSALSVNKPGFKEFDLANLNLDVGRMNEINGKLEVGTASETVAVQASAALIGAAGASGGKIADKKDTALLARSELAKSTARAAVPPPPPSAQSERVTVEAAAGTVETAQATGAGMNGALPVSKAKAPVQNVDAAAAAVKTEESKVAESTISSPVGSLTTNGCDTVSLMQLVQLQPQWRNSSGALQRSLDNGANWQTALRADHSLLCNAASANEVWTGGKKGSLFHSSDGGTTWTQVHPSVKGQTLTADVIRIEVRNPAEIAVSTSKKETWTTLDGGKTWQKK